MCRADEATKADAWAGMPQSDGAQQAQHVQTTQLGSARQRADPPARPLPARPAWRSASVLLPAMQVKELEAVALPALDALTKSVSRGGATNTCSQRALHSLGSVVHVNSVSLHCMQHGLVVLRRQLSHA